VIDELILRLLLVLGLTIGGVVLYLVSNRLLLLRARVLNAHIREGESGFVYSGKPVLLYFTTPTCAPCKTVQQPAIERLQARLGETLQVVEVDVAAEPEMAGRWGVMSVPTTFVLDAEGLPRFINHGVTLEEKLARQVELITSPS
jgi:thiol-disulfide isomerase/thioredoxin